jgi:hypothetical protein
MHAAGEGSMSEDSTMLARLRAVAEEAKAPGGAMVYDLHVAIARRARSQEEAERMIADRLTPLADAILSLLAVVGALPRCERCSEIATQADRGPDGDTSHACDVHAPVMRAEYVGEDGEPFVTMSDLDYAAALRDLDRLPWDEEDQALADASGCALPGEAPPDFTLNGEP